MKEETKTSRWIQQKQESLVKSLVQGKEPEEIISLIPFRVTDLVYCLVTTVSELLQQKAAQSVLTWVRLVIEFSFTLSKVMWWWRTTLD